MGLGGVGGLVVDVYVYIYFLGGGQGMVMQERKSPDFRCLEVGIYIHVPLTNKSTISV